MTIFSAASFVAPYRFTGLTALSVDSASVRGTSLAMAAATTFSAPRMFVLTASNGLYSQTGTCLSAAAWMTTSTPRIATRRRSPSRTSPIRKRTRSSPETARWRLYCLSSSRL